VCYLGIGYAGLSTMTAQWWYYLMFVIIAVVQCICYPVFNGVVAAWFPKHQRGRATMGFCTCINLGNIVGAQMAALLLRTMQWGWLMVFCAILFVILGVCQACLLSGDP